MNLVYHSHLGAEHQLASVGLLQDLDAVLRGMPLCFWPRKSRANPKLDVVQQVMNTWLEHEFVRRGWLSQHQVLEGDDVFFADFYRKVKRPWSLPGLPDAFLQALLEAQFGNASRPAMDNEKFRIGRIEGRCDVGIELLPTKAFAKRIDSNIANFENVRDLCVRLGPNGLQAPLLVIGIEPGDSTRVWDLRQSKTPLASLKKSAKAREAAVRAYQSK